MAFRTVVAKHTIIQTVFRWFGRGCAFTKKAAQFTIIVDNRRA